MNKDSYATSMLFAHCYTGDEMLMNPTTGSVDTAKQWAIDSYDWYDNICNSYCKDGECACVDVNEEYASLLQVIKDKKGNWVAKD